MSEHGCVGEEDRVWVVPGVQGLKTAVEVDEWLEKQLEEEVPGFCYADLIDQIVHCGDPVTFREAHMG